jgi:hypothetical protein
VTPLRASFRSCGRRRRTIRIAATTFIECLSNIFNTDGRPKQTTGADPRFVDYYGRPWAKNWEKYFEAAGISRRTSSRRKSRIFSRNR